MFMWAEWYYVLLLFTCYRLQYFARGVQAYIKQLSLALQGKTGDALKTEDVRHYITYHSLFDCHSLTETGDPEKQRLGVEALARFF